MRYRGGTVKTREYDFCHYELAKDPDPKMQEVIDTMRKTAKNGEVNLYVRFNKKKEMNVFIYKGELGERHSAKESIIPSNAQVELDKEYMIPVDKGMLIVAYPNKDKTTEFSFTYWIAGVV